MNYILRDIKNTSVFKEVAKKDNYPVEISGLVFVAKNAFISSLNNEKKKPIVVVTYNEIQAQEMIKNLSYFMDDVMLFPKREIAIYDYDAQSNEIEYQRIDVLKRLKNNSVNVIVTTIEAVMQSMIKEELLFENIIKVESGKEVNAEEIKQKLIDLGYVRTSIVENRAEFSVRGDIIDIAETETTGIRIELWGDEIDSIRRFRLSSQRSIEVLDSIEIYPARETVLVDSIENICKKIRNTEGYNIEKDIEEIQAGNYFNKIDKFFNCFYSDRETILDYADNAIIVIDEKTKINHRIKTIKEDNENLIKDLIEKKKDVPEALQDLVEFTLKKQKAIYLTEADSKENNLSYREINLIPNNEKIFIDSVNKYVKDGKKIIILAGTTENKNKIAKLFEEAVKVDDLDDILIKKGQIVISNGALTSGFENKETDLIVLSSDELFAVKKKKRVKVDNDAFNTAEKIVFADLKVGDYVVHINHGIGIFTGVKTIINDGITKDYICIQYRGTDHLYVPTENLDNVRKYIGGENNITLNKLGSKEWANTKARVKGNLRTVAKELIELYAKREKTQGFAFSEDTPWQKEFEDSFPYKETNDQIRCIDEVKQDMERAKPMDRLLCGDVGYGKTEVAIRAAFKAVMDSKQVAYLAPTTILASQQYKEFKERMKDYPIRCELLCRFRTAKEQKEIVEKLKKGELDVVIGTHRLLSQDVEFNNLGLLIIDEEHRFGVKAKEKIKEYKNNVDVLTMTATPIPRTLQMSIVGIRDMSVIYEPPQNRKPVQTYVLEYDTDIVKEAITKEIEKGGQVFYIYNMVEDIGIKAHQIENLVPEASVAYAHGKMSGNEIEAIMQDFIEKKTNVLVCTTILESGIDIPNANTIIVENADRFGLAQLYQIRGRVGRADKQAYAFITYRKDKMLSEDASQRLKAIKEFTEFGSGFKIATRDLQIRGAGSIFGEVQHGHIMQVGYDMYNRLLDEVVKEERGEKVEEQEDITIDINLSAYIPETYIEDSSQKIEIYQAIADCKNETHIQNVIDEIIDRYGNLPDEVNNLMEIARIKNLAREKNVSKIQKRGDTVIFTLKDFDMSKLDMILEKYMYNIKFTAGLKPYITLNIKPNDIEGIKEFLNIL